MTAASATLARHPVVRRVLEAVLTLLGVAVLIFVMLRALPGDQITAELGTEAAALSPAQRAAAARPTTASTSRCRRSSSPGSASVLTGNLGFSDASRQSVLDMTSHALPVTVELAVLAIVIGLLIGVPLGMLAASRPDATRDNVGQLVGLLALSIPAFLVATTSLTWLAKTFGWNPNGEEFATLTENPA